MKYYYFQLSKVSVTSDEVDISKWDKSAYTEISESVFNVLNLK